MLADVFYPDTVGGAGRVVYHLSLELNKKGHEIHVLTRSPKKRLSFFQKIDTHFFIHRFHVPANESLGLVFSEIKNSYQAAKRILREIDFDIVCINQCMSALGPLLHKQLNRLPAVYIYYSPWHQEFLTKKGKGNRINTSKEKTIAQFMKWIERLCLKKASRVFVLSNFSFNQVSRLHNIINSKVSINFAGIDLDKFKLSEHRNCKLRKEFGIPEDKTLFVTVRNLVPRMGIENLIRSFKNSQPLKQTAYLLIGGTGFLNNHLQDIVNLNALQDSIKFLGYIPDKQLPTVYQSADYFVLPTSSLEGFGLVILEAMACGTPVLGTPVGAIPEILGRFDERLIFRGTGWKDIQEKLEDVTENPDRYQFDQRICREFVGKNYSWEKMADEFEKKALELIN